MAQMSDTAREFAVDNDAALLAVDLEVIVEENARVMKSQKNA